jgi:hypothetical protein
MMKIMTKNNEIFQYISLLFSFIFISRERERERVVVGLLLGSLHGATVEEE